MDKKKLLELGLTEEQVTQVLENLKTNYVSKSKLDEKAVEITNLSEQLKARDEQINGLKKFEGDNEQLMAKLKELETINQTKASEYDNTLNLERKKSAIRFALLEDETGKPYDVSMVAGMFNLDTIKLNEDGTISEGFKEQNETLRKDKGFLFNTSQTAVKRFGATPPDGSKGKPAVDTPESYGARLAQNKLQMLGITPNNNEQ